MKLLPHLPSPSPASSAARVTTRAVSRVTDNFLGARGDVATCVTLHVIIFLQNYGEHAGSRHTEQGQCHTPQAGLISYIAVPGLRATALYACLLVNIFFVLTHLSTISPFRVQIMGNSGLLQIARWHKFISKTQFFVKWGTSLQSNEQSAVILQKREKDPHTHDTQLTADFSRSWARWPPLYPQLSGG